MPMTRRIFPNSRAPRHSRLRRQDMPLSIDRLSAQTSIQGKNARIVFDLHDGVAKQDAFGLENALKLEDPIVHQTLQIGSSQIGIANFPRQHVQGIREALAKCYSCRFEKSVTFTCCQLGVHLEQLWGPLPCGNRRMVQHATTAVVIGLTGLGVGLSHPKR